MSCRHPTESTNHDTGGCACGAIELQVQADLREQIAKLRASLEECLDEKIGLYGLGLYVMNADSEEEMNRCAKIADGIEERARTVLAETVVTP